MMRNFESVAQRDCKRCEYLKPVDREGVCEQCRVDEIRLRAMEMNRLRNRSKE